MNKTKIDKSYKFWDRVSGWSKAYFFNIDEIEKEITDVGLIIIERINLSNLPERFIVARKKIS